MHRAMNKFLKHVEEEGAKYGLKLNKKKCELLTNANRTCNVHFADGTPVPRKNEVTYLGCQLNQYSNTTQELTKRISACMTVLKKLYIFWRHSSCPVAFNPKSQYWMQS